MTASLVAIGELLIDFTPAGFGREGRPLYEQNPGGAPANVLTAAAKQGVSCALIACVGDDMFGRALISVCNEQGIDMGAVQITDAAATTMAFVSLNEQGDRSFAFARKPGADMLLEAAKMDMTLPQRCAVLHFGSLSLCDHPCKEATLAAVEQAGAAGALISYDPNWRPALWQHEKQGLEAMKEGLAKADVCKLSEEELGLLTGMARRDIVDRDTLEQGSKILGDTYPRLRLIVVTLGPKGCFYRLGEHTGCIPTYDTRILDTTGAGDGFWGVFLSELISGPLLTEDSLPALEQALRRANAAGAFCASGRGAMDSMATPEDIAAVMNSCRKMDGI